MTKGTRPWLAGLFPLLLAAAPATTGVDYEYVHDINRDVPQNNVVTFHQKYQWSLREDSEATNVRLQYRLWLDTKRPETREHAPSRDNIEKLILYVEHAADEVKVSAGLQEVTWGENLIMPILDVVNPRSLTHPRGYYDPAAKIPQAMLNTEWRRGDFKAQLIAVPVTESMPQPESAAGFGIDAPRVTHAGSDGEYGGSAGYLFEGVDTRLYYFRHWPRVPAYRFKAFSSDEADITTDDQMGDTFGASLSYAGLDWTFRADLARHTNFPVTGIGTRVERSNLTQAIVGLQFTSEDQKSIGTELHFDTWDQQPVAFSEGAWVKEDRGDARYAWVALTANANFKDGLVETFALYMHGVEKSDELARAAALYNATDHLAVGVEVQRTHSESTSPKLLLDKRETISARAMYTF